MVVEGLDDERMDGERLDDEGLDGVIFSAVMSKVVQQCCLSGRAQSYARRERRGPSAEWDFWLQTFLWASGKSRFRLQYNPLIYVNPFIIQGLSSLYIT